MCGTDDVKLVLAAFDPGNAQYAIFVGLVLGPDKALIVIEFVDVYGIGYRYVVESRQFEVTLYTAHLGVGVGQEYVYHPDDLALQALVAVGQVNCGPFAEFPF